ncbi:hypothetical protein [Sciscionella marina]|nr:hypothetical protein [Sciscionella marina]
MPRSIDRATGQEIKTISPVRASGHVRVRYPHNGQTEVIDAARVKKVKR